MCLCLNVSQTEFLKKFKSKYFPRTVIITVQFVTQRQMNLLSIQCVLNNRPIRCSPGGEVIDICLLSVLRVHCLVHYQRRLISHCTFSFYTPVFNLPRGQFWIYGCQWRPVDQAEWGRSADLAVKPCNGSSCWTHQQFVISQLSQSEEAVYQEHFGLK